jgi:hypothetical protein
VVDPSIFYENLKTKLAQCVGAGCVNAIESLGLLEEDLVVKLGTPLDSLSHFLSRKLSIGMWTEVIFTNIQNPVDFALLSMLTYKLHHGTMSSEPRTCYYGG